MKRTFIGGLIAPLLASTALADPPAEPVVPEVFCFRIADIERISGLDGTDGNDFVFDFEVLNWSDVPAGGVRIIANIGTSGRVWAPRRPGLLRPFRGSGSTATVAVEPWVALTLMPVGLG